MKELDQSSAAEKQLNDQYLNSTNPETLKQHEAQKFKTEFFQALLEELQTEQLVITSQILQLGNTLVAHKAQKRIDKFFKKIESNDSHTSILTRMERVVAKREFIAEASHAKMLAMFIESEIPRMDACDLKRTAAALDEATLRLQEYVGDRQKQESEVEEQLKLLRTKIESRKHSKSPQTQEPPHSKIRERSKLTKFELDFDKIKGCTGVLDRYQVYFEALTKLVNEEIKRVNVAEVSERRVPGDLEQRQ
jgi:hypothetical protein